MEAWPTEERLRGFVETLRQGLREGTVKPNATVKLVQNRGDDRIIASFGFWDGVSTQVKDRLRGMNGDDFDALEELGLVEQVGYLQYRINPTKLLY